MALFKRPEDANEGQPIQAPAPGPRALDVEDMTDGVHLIPGAAPGYNVIFVADLFGFQGEVTPANQNALAFADRLDELGLEFDTVIPVYGQRATAQQFWEAVRLGREQQAGR